jgi:hypothetical protein
VGSWEDKGVYVCCGLGDSGYNTTNQDRVGHGYHRPQKLIRAAGCDIQLNRLDNKWVEVKWFGPVHQPSDLLIISHMTST